MSRTEKYRGIFPAFYACYEDDGRISGERAQAFTKYLIGKGVQGLYVGGSSGECIYQSVEERKELLENVMEAAGGKLVVIAHVACNNTKDTLPLLQKMRENPRVIGVKNSSMPVQDIQIFQAAGSEDWVVFNGPDEQFVSGRAMGAAAGIGGTYAAMPELYLAMDRAFREGRMEDARTLQYRANEIIGALCSCRANMYAVIKELLRMDGMDIGGVRPPLVNVTGEDLPKIRKCREMIDQAISEPVCRI